MPSRRFLASVGLVALAAGLAAQQPAEPLQPRLPPFRGGANLVRVDAYVTENGRAVTDLTADDFEVLEDNAPQQVEQFERVEPPTPGPEATRVEPNTVRDAAAMAADPRARLFVLFMDVWHVQLAGSYRAQEPVGNLLERLIGQDDMVGVMTPEMSARNLTFARRTSTLQAMMRTNWYWGERDQLPMTDPREQEFQQCYRAYDERIADEMIDRRREKKTLDAIEEMIVHLEGVREERKFVILLSEGWRLFRPSDQLGARLGTEPVADPVYVTPGGRVGIGSDPRQQQGDMAGCERERQLLANLDNEMTFRLLVQRANRSNVSFYAIDPRGLVAFDEAVGPRRPASMLEDGRRLFNRQQSLMTLAHETDGTTVLNTNDVSGAVERIMTDLGSYYLLGYYSTNTRLDGRYRRLTVRVKRPGLEVRARPGYLAPLESELRAARAAEEAPVAAAPPMAITSALGRLGAGRASMPLRVEAAGYWAVGAAAGEPSGGAIRVVVELDTATVRQAEWQAGGEVRVTLEPPSNVVAEPVSVTRTLAAGQRTIAVDVTVSGGLEPGRYIVRAQATPEGGRLPLQLSVGADVPEDGALLATGPVALRRGPTTGLAYLPTADPRFRRTERLRLEVPISAPGAEVFGRLLDREGRPMALPVAVSERTVEDSGGRYVMADLTLAPLAQGEYILELGATRSGTSDSVHFAFRIVP